MNHIRRRIFDIIEAGSVNDNISKGYDIFMFITIVASIVPLVFRYHPDNLIIIEKVTVTIFIIDYILRLITADFKLGRGRASFIRYPFTFMAIVDLLSILPAIVVINNSLKLFRIFRLFEAMLAIRVFKFLRYSRSIRIILNVFRQQRDALCIVGALVIGYIFMSAVIVFSFEPQTFNSFFDAIYWATISITTIGYGDIVTVSAAGKIITMLSALAGIAIIALPASILTAGYMEEIKREREEEGAYESEYGDDEKGDENIDGNNDGEKESLTEEYIEEQAAETQTEE